MRRAALLALLGVLALGSSPAGAASWAQPQIRVVVAEGLMGPSVSGFRPQAPLTRGALANAVARLTGVAQTLADPGRAVRMRALEHGLVRAAGMLGTARRVQDEAAAAGLSPPARFDLPELTTWQRRILTRAVSFVGFPYVWGGTSERRQTLFGVTSRGGFDCSGFAWRIYRLQRYSGGEALQDTLRGRTASQMAGEVPKSARIGRAGLKPGDLVFFSEQGKEARPADVSHMGIYLGRGWFVHSSSQGTTMTTFSGWYAERFARGRRPLREAGLA